VVELTHLATLYQTTSWTRPRCAAACRRPRPLDNSIAILTGDFLFAKASQILADLGPRRCGCKAETFERLVTGQINECIGRRTARPRSTTI